MPNWPTSCFSIKPTLCGSASSNHPDEALCLHFLLAAENGKGVANFFATLRARVASIVGSKRKQPGGGRPMARSASSASSRSLNDYLPDPEWHKPLAYVLAWLRVAGGNSVLPPWVSLAFPKTRESDRACCAMRPATIPIALGAGSSMICYKLLPRYFPGITQFRATPATA